MSREELEKKLNDGWMNIGRFSNISVTIDEQRQFLEAISGFRVLEQQGLVKESGVPMPNCGKIVVGNITGMEFVPDYSVEYVGGNSSRFIDGNIIVLQAK